ncbi:MAG: diguanylate cyclase domain-containing protein [Acidimicrobiales bacterium]
MITPEPGSPGTAGTEESFAALLAHRGLGTIAQAFSAGTGSQRNGVARYLESHLPQIQSYVTTRTEKLDGHLDAQSREALQWEQDTNLARGNHLISQWIQTGQPPTRRDLAVISTVGSRAAGTGGGFGRILRAIIASRDATSAVVADACHLLGVQRNVLTGLLAGVHVGHDRALFHAAMAFDERSQALAVQLSAQRGQLAELAREDPLTGTANRRGFYEEMTALVTQRRRRKSGELALFFVDLDHFKELNDAHGHQVGDEVLKVVAERLRDTARPTDLVARLGGDEFVVVMNNLPDDLGRLDDLAGRLLDAVRAPVIAFGHTVTLTASVGVAKAPERLSDPDMLVNAADNAMYTAKANGRDTYSVALDDQTDTDNPWSSEADATAIRQANSAEQPPAR